MNNKICRKRYLLITVFIALFVLSSCASTKPYRGSSIDADSIKCDKGSRCADIRTGKYFIDVGGIKRRFIVTLPENYDHSKSYPLIFAWHGFGGSAYGVASGYYRSPYFGILRASENQAIFIAGHGLVTLIPGLVMVPGKVMGLAMVVTAVPLIMVGAR